MRVAVKQPISKPKMYRLVMKRNNPGSAWEYRVAIMARKAIMKMVKARESGGIYTAVAVNPSSPARLIVVLKEAPASNDNSLRSK